MPGIIETWRATRNGAKMLVDLSIMPGTRDTTIYHQTEEMVYLDTSDIIRRGYRRCEGLKTDLCYYGMPIYVRFNGWRKYDYHKGFTNETGEIVDRDDPHAIPMPLDTASTLADYYKSNAMENFWRGMLTRVSTVKELDMKMVGTIAIVGVGAALGIFMLMNGGH